MGAKLRESQLALTGTNRRESTNNVGDKREDTEGFAEACSPGGEGDVLLLAQEGERVPADEADLVTQMSADLFVL